MKSKSPIKYFLLSFLVISILVQPIQSYAQQTTVSDADILEYLDRIAVIQKQIDYLGQTAYITESTGASNTNLQSNIAFTAGEIQQLLNDIQTNTKGVDPASMAGRNTNFLNIILNYFSNALNELNVFLTSEDDYEEFDALERYLYNKTISDQTITWLRNNI